MRTIFAAAIAALHLISAPASADSGAAEAAARTLVDDAFVADIRGWAESNVFRMTLDRRNRDAGDLDQARIDELDKTWRAEREQTDQPLITSVLTSPLSAFLTRIQARSLGLYSEIFVMDRNGLNAGQSAITSDYWQGDEAKFQKTYDVGADAVFLDESEFNEETGTWRAQLNLTLHDEAGRAIGAITVEINLTELARRRAARQS